MAVSLGVPSSPDGSSLARRITWLSAARLLLLLVLLALIGLFYVRRELDVDSYTVRVAMVTFAAAFALAAGYGLVLRSGRHLLRLADFQLVCDQLTWTVIVYLSGGASSGATSFYGLSCLAGAVLTGLRGAGVAAVAGGICYLSLAAAIRFGWLGPPPDQPARLYQLDTTELSYYLLVNLLALVVVTLLGGYLAERLRLTGGELALARQRAQRAEHMAALGQLAAGLAHEIRNPLGSIAGCVQMLKHSDHLSEEEHELCGIVEREVSSLNDLVTDMMDLARPRKPEMVEVDVACVARDVVELASHSGRAASDVRVQYQGPEHATVAADAAQLRQMLWNLVRNAVQASSPEDVVTVKVAQCSGCVSVTVADNGIGIDNQARERLFDAFFTTRSKGAGVGLAVVKRIVDEHGFSIDVSSERGRGAEFRVDLGKALPGGPCGERDE
jgi:two-component system sensor histidine kinase HydH